MLRRKEKEGWQEGEIHHTLTHHVHMGELTRKRTHSLTHTHTHTHTHSLSLSTCAPVLGRVCHQPFRRSS